jgi:hypothetical protein
MSGLIAAGRHWTPPEDLAGDLFLRAGLVRKGDVIWARQLLTPELRGALWGEILRIGEVNALAPIDAAMRRGLAGEPVLAEISRTKPLLAEELLLPRLQVPLECGVIGDSPKYSGAAERFGLQS